MKMLLSKFIVLTLFSLVLMSCCCPTNPTPNGLISEAKAENMSDLYIANQYMYINKNMPGEDNLSVNFSLEELEDYICLIKKEADGNYENLGLRVHFAAEKVLYEGDSIPRTTVFFVPTSDDGTTVCQIPNGSILNMGDSGNVSLNSPTCNGG